MLGPGFPPSNLEMIGIPTAEFGFESAIDKKAHPELGRL